MTVSIHRVQNFGNSQETHNASFVYIKCDKTTLMCQNNVTKIYLTS